MQKAVVGGIDRTAVAEPVRASGPLIWVSGMSKLARLSRTDAVGLPHFAVGRRPSTRAIVTIVPLLWRTACAVAKAK
jgi:hypothetical protein